MIALVLVGGQALGRPADRDAAVLKGTGEVHSPVPAGSSRVESSDIPGYQAPPERFAVAPFENRAGVRAFDWLVAGAPFEIATKTESVLELARRDGLVSLHPLMGGMPPELGWSSLRLFAEQVLPHL